MLAQLLFLSCTEIAWSMHNTIPLYTISTSLVFSLNFDLLNSPLNISGQLSLIPGLFLVVVLLISGCSSESLEPLVSVLTLETSLEDP